MPSQIASALQSIHPVLNATLLKSSLEEDIKSGFDPSKDYRANALNDPSISEYKSPHFLRSADRGGKYIFLVLHLQKTDHGEKTGHQVDYEAQFVRGFEQREEGHVLIAQEFLQEISSVFKRTWKLPYLWPFFPGTIKPQSSIILSRKDMQLSIHVIGGGCYTFQKKRVYSDDRDQLQERLNSLDIWGGSRGFGPVPAQYNKALQRLIRDLVTQEPYIGWNPFFINDPKTSH